MIELTPEQLQALASNGENPPRMIDPDTKTTYVLLQADVYQRFKALFEDDPITEQERLFQLREFGRRGGWDDPEMDVYNELDPRRQS